MGNEENGCGWVVKGPFTTNSQCIKFVHSFDEMKVSMCTLSKKIFREFTLSDDSAMYV